MSDNQEQWVEPSKRTTAWYLFNKHFFCLVANMQSMSAEYIRFHGMPSTGVKQYDDAMANELVQRSLTINQMVEMHKRGVNVELVDQASSKTIYDFIEAHLLAWKNQLTYSFGTTDEEVIKDLIYLDNFANVIYKHAKYHFAVDALETEFARKISGILSISNATLLGPMKKPQSGDPTTPLVPVDTRPVYPERASIRDFFINAAPAPAAGLPPRKWSN